MKVNSKQTVSTPRESGNKSNLMTPILHGGGGGGGGPLLGDKQINKNIPT